MVLQVVYIKDGEEPYTKFYVETRNYKMGRVFNSKFHQVKLTKATYENCRWLIINSLHYPSDTKMVTEDCTLELGEIISVPEEKLDVWE